MRVVSWLLLGLLAWQGAYLGWGCVRELFSIRLSALVAALSYTEEQRIEVSMRTYDPEGESLGLYELYCAIRDNSAPHQRVFALPGDDPLILRAMTGLSGFYYPRRINISRRLPSPEERSAAPELLVLTMRGPYQDAPRGFKEPIVTTPQWTLWK